MVTARQRGFTVIEVMLFLGVTGALFAALMYGVGSSVNQQRYRESVVSLGVLLQGQYSEVSNTRNDNTNDWSCTTDGKVEQDSSTAVFRGTSPCVLLGKAVQIDKGQITIYRVVGCEPPKVQGSGHSTDGCGAVETNDDESISDRDALKLYRPKITEFDRRDEQPEWNSTLRDTTEKHDLLTGSFLIVRSPASGLLRVYTVPGKLLPANLSEDLIDSPDAAKTKLSMCVFGDSIIAAKQSVTVDPTVSGPDGIIINQSDGELCG